jgi:hypothetical protein
VSPAFSPPGLEFLGSTQLGSAAATTATVTIPARDVLIVLVRVTGYAGGGDIASLRLNGDTGANYWSRYLSWAAGGTTVANNQNVSQTLARMFALAQTQGRNAIIGINNLTGATKVGNVNGQSGTGAAATAGTLEQGGFEWANTAAQITSIVMVTAGGANMNTGSGFAVYGRNL